MVNMQQFMKVTSILVAGSHSTTEFVTQFLFMNMVTDHFKELIVKRKNIILSVLSGIVLLVLANIHHLQNKVRS